MINGKKLVALCTSRIYDPQIHGYIVKLNERLRAEDYSLLIFAINSDIYWEENRQAAEKYIFKLIPYNYIDAVVIMDEKIKSHKISEYVIEHSNENNVPVIIADGHYDGAYCINFDYEKGFEQVVRHIIEDHKVTRPHMIAGQPDNDFSNNRIKVFKKVLEENTAVKLLLVGGNEVLQLADGDLGDHERVLAVSLCSENELQVFFVHDLEIIAVPDDLAVRRGLGKTDCKGLVRRLRAFCLRYDSSGCILHAELDLCDRAKLLQTSFYDLC